VENSGPLSATPVLLLFVDGVGIGERDASRNPLARGDFLLAQFSDGSGTHIGAGQRFDLDACLTVPGRPQSASNQATLYTGQNVPALLGKHLLGFPNGATAEVIQSHTVFRRLKDAGAAVRLLNAFPDAVAQRYQSRSDSSVESTRLNRRIRPSASVLACLAADVHLATFSQVSLGLALPHDIDGASARLHGFELPALSVESAADVALRGEFDFTLFEYFATDFAGHNRSFEEAEHCLTQFDKFLRRVLERKPEHLQVLVVSDHGNIEDLSLRNHTRNSVPLLSFGPRRIDTLHSLTDVAPMIERWVLGG
jgi:2,3-bisphosphoglycerate-independent phosphoglycerate mutase